jgi:hypothetical protein
MIYIFGGDSYSIKKIFLFLNNSNIDIDISSGCKKKTNELVFIMIVSFDYFLLQSIFFSSQDKEKFTQISFESLLNANIS